MALEAEWAGAFGFGLGFPAGAFVCGLVERVRLGDGGVDVVDDATGDGGCGEAGDGAGEERCQGGHASVHSPERSLQRRYARPISMPYGNGGPMSPSPLAIPL